MKPSRISIRLKFGGLYLLLFGLITAVGILVLNHVGRMRQDARILLEETREHSVARDILANVDGLAIALKNSELASGNLAAVTEAIDLVRAELGAMRKDNGDPSREEHQEAEDRLLEELDVELQTLTTNLQNGVFDAGDEPEAVHRVRTFAEYLIEETREEYLHADRDLDQQGDATQRAMAWMVLFVALTLGASLAFVYFSIVQPIRRLERSAKRIGAGELTHRIEISNRDELGSLANSFNEMARRIAESHAELEELVAERTREYIRAARLADLGILAAGIAHEINNPLGSIVACAEGLERRMGEGISKELLADYLGTILKEAQRSQGITSRLLQLARKDSGELSSVELDLIFDHVAKTSKYLLAQASVNLELEAPPAGLRIHGNAGELIQVCMNLVVNARDASSPGSSVRIAWSVDDQDLTILVRDWGCGIEPDEIEHVFEPFYTTKGAGKGTGLGLPLVSAMAQARGGTLRVSSTPGRGTDFTLVLPLTWKEAA